MAPGAVIRRLRAIAVLDVVGYSKLMGADEVGTHRDVSEIFRTIARPAADACGGRIVHRAGDGLLLEFESATDAVQCALSIQRAVRSLAEQADGDRRRIELRVGINVGDIIFDGDDIAGDGVNIAARLESIAPPGGILVSRSVREQLPADFAATVVDAGDVHLKHIARAVRAYRIVDGPVTWRQRVAAWRASNKTIFSPPRLTLYLVATAGIATAAVLQVANHDDGRSAAAPAMSLAVMPFDAKADVRDPSAANRLAEQVMRGLAATSWMQVVAPGMATPSGSDADDVVSIGHRLNVRYLLFGHVDRSGDLLALDVQLIDAASGISAWTARLNQRAGQPESALSLSTIIPLREAVYEAESKRLIQSGARPRTPMEYKMLGDHAGEGDFITLQSDRKAKALYEKGLELDPNFVPLLISVGYTLVTELELDPDVNHEATVQRMDSLSKRIVANDPSSAPGWQYRAETLSWQWRWDAAFDASDKAVALDPGRALGLAHRARLLNLVGRPDEALDYIDKALALPEQRVGFAQLERCRAQMALGRYRNAVFSCQKSVATEEGWMQHAYLTACYALLDDEENTTSEKKALLHSYPAISIAKIKDIRYSNIKEYLVQSEAHWYRGLRKAGIPES